MVSKTFFKKTSDISWSQSGISGSLGLEEAGYFNLSRRAS